MDILDCNVPRFFKRIRRPGFGTTKSTHPKTSPKVEDLLRVLKYFKEGHSISRRDHDRGKPKEVWGGGGGEPTCVFILCVAYEAVEERTNI